MMLCRTKNNFSYLTHFLKRFWVYFYTIKDTQVSDIIQIYHILKFLFSVVIWRSINIIRRPSPSWQKMAVTDIQLILNGIKYVFPYGHPKNTNKDSRTSSCHAFQPWVVMGDYVHASRSKSENGRVSEFVCKSRRGHGLQRRNTDGF